MLKSAIGLRAHSGLAVAVAIAGGAAVARRRIELCDREVAGSAQPYHAAASMPLRQAEAYLKRCAEVSAAIAEAAMREIAEDLAARGYGIAGCSILLGSGRPLGELAKTLAAHPLIHTAEGEFYREACRRCGMPIRGVKERDAAPLVDEVAALGKATRSTVLLSDVVFVDGSWQAALRLARDKHSLVTVLVIADRVDWPFLRDLFDRGACGVIWRPFEFEVVRRQTRAVQEASKRRRVLQDEILSPQAAPMGGRPLRGVPHLELRSVSKRM